MWEEKLLKLVQDLIDMTAKKMADIFFGKFSELISLLKIQMKIQALNN